VFNYNNNFLVELRLLYMCRTAFAKGIAITQFFEVHLASLFSESSWAEDNPEFARK